MSNSDKDAISVSDRSSRRRFIRRGAAFVAVSGLASAAPAVYADDCDRNQGQEKNAQAPGSDSDTGESADPTACGKNPKPKISQHRNVPEVNPLVKVGKVKA